MLNEMPPMMPGAMPAAPEAPMETVAPAAAPGDPFLGGGPVAPMSAGDEMSQQAQFLDEEMMQAEMDGDTQGLENLQSERNAITDKRALYLELPDMPTEPFRVPMKDEDPTVTDEAGIQALMVKSDDPIVDVIPGPEGRLFAVKLSQRGFKNDPILTAIRKEAKSIESIGVVVVDGVAVEAVILPDNPTPEDFSVAADEMLGVTELLDAQETEYKTHWVSVSGFKKYL